MAGPRAYFRRLKRFLKEDIWELNIEELSRMKARLVRDLKILIITIRTFSAQKIGSQAVALSFFCTMAVVPFLAIAFAVTGGLGQAERLRDLLYANFDNQETIDMVLGFAANIIDTAQSGPVGLVSALLFFWLVIWMMMSVERAFNNVWKVESRRNFFQSLGFYIAILILSPFVIMLFFSGSIVYSHVLDYILPRSVSLSEGIISLVGWVIFGTVAVLVFSVMYKYIPHAKVRFSCAFDAAIISGIAFTILQYLYLETQLFVTRLNTIYGAMAAIPLFMFWLNFGWFIILFGAELSYAFQNVDHYYLPDGSIGDIKPDFKELQ
ncbi:MAG: YihY/virulence factor BrkB family protein [Bacteroidales bacterium]|nr:YihY/virulence factor BrkB family protein [Bacteroidales bacterium]